MKKQQLICRTLLMLTISVLFSFLPQMATAQSKTTLVLVGGERGGRGPADALLQALNNLTGTEACQHVPRCRAPELRVLQEPSATQDAALGKLQRQFADLALLPLTAVIGQQAKGLQMLAQFEPQPVQLLVRTSVSYRSFSQLAGARLALGPAGSPTRQVAEAVLPVLGVPLRRVQVSQISDAHVQRTALRNGKLDGVLVWGMTLPLPLAQALEAGEVRRLLPSKTEMQQVRLQLPALPLVTLPDIEGLPQRLPGVPLMLVTHGALTGRSAEGLVARLRLLAQSQKPTALPLQLTGDETAVLWHPLLRPETGGTSP